MARPRKRAEWYQHFTDMKNNPCIRALRKRFGNNGYAVLNYLMEDITRTDELVLDFSPKKRLLYAAEYDVTQEELENIVDFCVELDLCMYLDDDKSKLCSPYLEEELLKLLLERREKDRQRKLENNKREFSTENPKYSTENGRFSTENNAEDSIPRKTPSIPRKTPSIPRKTPSIPRKTPSIPRKSTHSIVEYSRMHSSSADIRAREGEEAEELVNEEQPEIGDGVADEVAEEDDVKHATNLAAEVDAEVNALLFDVEWKIEVFERFKFLKGDEKALKDNLLRWAGEVRMRNRGHTDLTDAKDHFKNWLIIQEDKLNQNLYRNGTDNNNGYRTSEDIYAGAARIMQELRAEGAAPKRKLPVV